MVDAAKSSFGTRLRYLHPPRFKGSACNVQPVLEHLYVQCVSYSPSPMGPVLDKPRARSWLYKSLNVVDDEGSYREQKSVSRPSLIIYRTIYRNFPGRYSKKLYSQRYSSTQPTAIFLISVLATSSASYTNLPLASPSLDPLIGFYYGPCGQSL